MPGENLTREEARERAAHIHVDNYDIGLDLTTSETTFRSTTTVTFTADAGRDTFIDLVDAAIHSITLNGAELDAASVYADSRIQLTNLAESNTLTVVADCAYTNTGEGLHRFVDPVDDEVYLYTQFEVPDSRRVFAVFEQPDLKATFTFTVTAPAHWKVMSNSVTPEPSQSDDERNIWRFEPTGRISSYITAIVAGPYEGVESELTTRDGRTIPLGVYARASLVEHLDADEIIDITRRGFAFYEERFDTDYPFTKYDQIFVPEFNAGAMENAGCVTFTETYVFRSKVTDAIRERRVVTILHELAHMWFGDLVTMRWWDDLWLNESFAEWASTLATAEATEWSDAWTTFTAMEKSWAYKQDQLPSTHPIAADIRDLEDVLVNFDGITYAKGASVLKQLVAWVGYEHFCRGVSEYFTKHAWQNTTLDDLFVELEAASGRDLSDWADKWLKTSQVNLLRPRLAVDSDGVITAASLEQTAVSEHPTLRPHRLAIGLYNLGSDGVLGRTQRIELDVDGESTEVSELIGVAQPDLLLVNDDDLAYAKVRLDARSWKTAMEHLSALEWSLPRSLVWGAAWDATRDGEIPARDYIAFALKHLGVEDQSTTLRTTLQQVVLAARQYVTPERRRETIITIADGLLDLARKAEAGSDQQLQFVKAFAQVATTADQIAALKGFYDGSGLLDGLVIDTDLKWELLDGLVQAGVAGKPEIVLQLSSDDTASGRQAAARARATIPTVEGKRAAFDSLVVDDSAPNAIVRATWLGFGNINDPQPLVALAGRYFTSLLGIWNSRSHAIAEAIVTGLYPAALADSDLLTTGQDWLDRNVDAPAGLRRLVAENVAGTRRALRAQQTDWNK